MRKFTLIPAAGLGLDAKGSFLEIMSEPASFGGINMAALMNCGLQKNIKEVDKVLSQLPAKPGSTHLFLTGYLANVGNTQGINLGLILAGFLQHVHCPYQKIIVTGSLDLIPPFSVSAAVYFDAKIQVIINMGRQPNPTPFFYPKAMQSDQNKPLLLQLEALNIILKPIETLLDALLDFGIYFT